MAVEQASVAVSPGACVPGLGAAEISSPALRDLYLYWLEKWQGARMPARADIEPLEIPTLLPVVYLVDIEGDPRRFRFRLIGTRIVAWFGRDLTGGYLSDQLVARYAEVADSGRPAYDALYAPSKEGRHGFYQRLLLPLAGEDGGTAMLLGGIRPTPVPV